MDVKHSVSSRIANYLVIVVIFVTLIASLSLTIIASNLSYAEAINVSGSLRMQSYRLLHQLEKEPQMVKVNLHQYQISLHSPPLMNLKHQLFTPDDIKSRYTAINQSWRKMEKLALANDVQGYQNHLTSYVNQVDEFVLALQKNAEQKWTWAVVIILLSMLSIAIMVSYVIWYTQKAVANPLRQLAQASIQVQLGQFNHIPLDTRKDDELGNLARSFTKMSSELSKLYMRLEARVNEKTQKLLQTNRSLSSLYYCSQVLTTNHLTEKILSQVLQHILINENLRYISLKVLDTSHWNIEFGARQEHIPLQKIDVEIEGEKLAHLSWQAGLPCADLRTMENLSRMISRALYFHKAQRQQEQFLLMEERSIIARELHDSLAQVLSFLQIQLALLKNNLNKEGTHAKSKSLSIIHDFEQALNNGYTQLRELLATFRLTVQEADFQVALQQVIDSLRNQTEMQIVTTCSLPSQTFNAPQLVNALQIVREAVLNAIKYSQGTLIEVIAHINDNGEYELVVRDNGVGIPSLHEPDGHYGLNIMQERTKQLNATLKISNRTTGGTEVKVTISPHNNDN